MTTRHGASPNTDRMPLSQSWWRRDDSVPLVDHTVGSLLTERAAELPDSPALVGMSQDGSARRLTYGELYAEAVGVAQALLRFARPGEYVALWAPNLVEWPIVQYGAALAGLRLVALNPVLRPHELSYALNHSESVVLVHADRSRDYELAAVVAQVRGECPKLRHVSSLSAWRRLTAEGEDATAALPVCDPDAPAMLQYTSGTTGTPKGVVLRHRSLVNVARLTMETAEVERRSVAMNPLPMFHTASCVIGTLGPLWLGGCVVLVDRFEPGAALETLRAERVDVLFSVPTVLAGIAAAAAIPADEPVPRLRTVMCGAAAASMATIERAEDLFGAAVHNLFGQTELAPVLAMTRRGDSRDDLVHTLGTPLPQVDCKIVDPASGDVQPLGVAGEICARGYQQLVEYLHDRESTARTVDENGWVHTGDLGTMDERGVLTLAGRLKELIIRGGENIAPAEVESCLLEHAAVLEAAVVGVPDEKWGETVGAVVLPSGDAGPRLRERLEAYCRDRLAPFKVPRRWLFVDELPTTPTGKVRKFELVEAFVDDGRP